MHGRAERPMDNQTNEDVVGLLLFRTHYGQRYATRITCDSTCLTFSKTVASGYTMSSFHYTLSGYRHAQRFCNTLRSYMTCLPHYPSNYNCRYVSQLQHYNSRSLVAKTCTSTCSAVFPSFALHISMTWHLLTTCLETHTYVEQRINISTFDQVQLANLSHTESGVCSRYIQRSDVSAFALLYVHFVLRSDGINTIGGMAIRHAAKIQLVAQVNIDTTMLL